MNMKLILKSGVGAFLIAAAIISVARSQEMVEKSGQLTQSADGRSTFKIDGGRSLNGSLRILSQPGNQVELSYKKWARAGSRSQAERFIDLIDVRLQAEPDRVVLSILSPADAPWSGSGDNVVMEIFVQLPEKMKIEGDLQFMKLEVRGPFPGVTISSGYSPISLQDINGPTVVSASYARIDMTDIVGSVKAETRYAPIQASDIKIPFGSAIFKSSGDTITLSNIQGPVEAYTTYAVINVSDIDAAEGSIVLQTSYSPINAENISGELICQTSFSPINISEINLTHGHSKIETSYSPINIELVDIGDSQLFLYNNYNNITLSLPSKISLQLVANVDDGGRIRTQSLPIRPTYLGPTRLEGILGSGGGRIELKVGGIGEINIHGQ